MGPGGTAGGAGQEEEFPFTERRVWVQRAGMGGKGTASFLATELGRGSNAEKDLPARQAAEKAAEPAPG